MKHPREFDIYRPHEGECPPHIVNSDAAGPLPLDFIRIMKDGDLVIGAYKFECVSTTSYRILTLQVIDAYRGRGIGRWLLAHALGVIESKGGRSVEIEADEDCEMCRSMGFRRTDGNTLKLDLIPD